MSRYQNRQSQGSPAQAKSNGASGSGVGPVLHPRLHAVSKPYSRPSSYAGLSSSSSSARNLAQLANGNGNANGDHHDKIRDRLPTSASTSSLVRSGSDSSLFSGIKSIFSKPFGWLATPSKDLEDSADAEAGFRAGAGKRDSLSSFGHELEEPESPSDRRDGKRLRRQSPDRPRLLGNGHLDGDDDGVNGNPYEPRQGQHEHAHDKFQVQGRAVTGFMLPALSPNISLKPKSHLASPSQKPLPPFPTNFSRPLNAAANTVTVASGSRLGSGTLASSKSMSYLDPPSHLLRNGNGSSKAAASPSRAGPLTRSKRMELASLADDEEMDITPVETQQDHKGKAKEDWSPWKSKYPGISGAAAAAASPRATMSPGRKTAAQAIDQRDYTLPSLSPFRQPQSPLARHVTSGSGLTRSATTANLRSGRSNGLEVSTSLSRAGSLRPSGSMLFGSVNGDKEDDRMSVDGEQRQREGSVLDWFMRDQWSGREPSSPSSVAASKRLGGASSTVGHPPLRKGQLVWNEEEKVFVRESDLKASKQPQPVHKTEAERILWTLESMRKTPLSDARKNDFYPSIIGQSSRTWRKTINVPLSTAAAGDNAKKRRDRLGDGDLSIMISPYGRRKAADDAARDVRRQRAETDAEYRPSPSPSPSVDERQQSRSPAASVERSASVSSRAPSSAPSATPRRSSRLRQRDDTHEEAHAPTPKAKKSTRRGASTKSDVTMEEQATPRKTRGGKGKGRAGGDKASSPTRDSSESHAHDVPTITETAPSPGGAPASGSTYQPGARSQESSSLRARSDNKRTHQSAAAYSRSATPSGGSGRYSAKEEDLPDLEELEKVSKIPLPSFAGISFAGFQPPATSSPAQAETAETSTSVTDSATAQSQSSLALPPIGKRPGGPLARLGQSTRPRASSPLAAGSIVPEPDSPPHTAKPKSSAPSHPANGFSFNTDGATPTVRLQVPGGSTTPAGKPPASSGFFAAPAETNKASGPAGTGTESDDRPSSIPNFFGNRSTSAPDSGASTPKPAAQIFDFGLSKPKPEEQKVVTGPSSFSFSAPAPSSKPAEPTANGSSTGFSFGAKPADTAAPSASAAPAFSFGAPKPAESTTSKPSFSFGTPSSTPVPEKPAEAAKPSFSFGAPSAAKPAEAATPAFSFGTPSSATSAKPVEAAKPAFSFGTPTAEAPKAAEPAKSTFSFGQTAAKPAETAKPAFTFGAGSASTPASSSPFGAPAANGASTPTTPTFTFGKPDAPKPAEPAQSAASVKNPFGTSAPSASTSSPFGANGTSNPFGQSATPPTSSSSSTFTFGAQPAAAPAAAAPQPSNPFAFGSGPAAPASNPFGSSATAQPSAPAPASSSTFAFGAPSASAAPANPFGGASQQQPSTPSAASGFNFAFGAPGAAGGTTTPGGSSFAFGQTQPQQANSRPSTPGVGANPGFSFGTPAPSAAPFAFGQQPSTTPAGAPPPAAAGGFSFGAPAGPAPGTPGSSTQPLFGAPAPDAGFSLGVGDPQSAGSPARKVKGLPSRRGGRR